MEPRGVTGPHPERGGVRVVSVTPAGGPPPPAGCGAPSVWSADGRATVLSCIGCGRIDTAQQCAGTCGEHRLEIVPAATHDRVLARLAAERERADGLAALAERLAAQAPAAAAGGWEGAYRSLRAEARALLRGPAGPPPPGERDAPAQRLVVWACGGCGRAEADAPCVGVCTDEPIDVVRAAVHDQACAELAACRARAREPAALARLLASTTPRRAGDWETSLRALQRRARQIVARARAAA